jgi:hypothetical protein
MQRIAKIVLLSAVVVFIVTAAAKLYAVAFASDKLVYTDPVFGMPVRPLLAMVGVWEIGLAAGLLLLRDMGSRLCLLTWASGVLLIYRFFGRNFHVCSCLGGLFGGYHWFAANGGVVFLCIAGFFFLSSLPLWLCTLTSEAATRSVV